jgi:hypothetical protein
MGELVLNNVKERDKKFFFLLLLPNTPALHHSIIPCRWHIAIAD